MARKLGKRTDQRMAMLRNQVSELLWYGEIETTVDRAKEVRRMAEKLITLAVRTYQDEVTVTKSVKGAKGEKSDVQFTNDGAKKLAARRRLMAELRDLQEMRKEKESKAAYNARIKDVHHPLIEKMFKEYAPKYDARAAELGKGGGYTRILRTGVRRGDAARYLAQNFVSAPVVDAHVRPCTLRLPTRALSRSSSKYHAQLISVCASVFDHAEHYFEDGITNSLSVMSLDTTLSHSKWSRSNE